MAQPIQDAQSVARYLTGQAQVGNGAMATTSALPGANAYLDTGLASIPEASTASQMMQMGKFKGQAAQQNANTGAIAAVNRVKDMERGQTNAISKAEYEAETLKNNAVATVIAAGNMKNGNILAMANSQIAHGALEAVATQGNIKRAMGFA